MNNWLFSLYSRPIFVKRLLNSKTLVKWVGLTQPNLALPNIT